MEEISYCTKEEYSRSHSYMLVAPTSHVGDNAYKTWPTD